MTHAIVSLEDGTITSISLSKYLASQMTIIEECNAEDIKEKQAYWDRIYHYPKTKQLDTPMYHFYNKEQKKHLWSIHKSPTLALKGIRDRSGYKLLSSTPQ